MLLIPNAVSQLIQHRPHIRHGHGHGHGQQQMDSDVEKSADPLRFTPGGGRGAPRRPRPADLVMVGDDFQDMLEGSSDHADTTRTNRTLPIFSGIMIPFSIMLSIPGLTGHWYIRTGDNNETVETRPNPLLLDIATGLSMGCGILACACLVVRFAERRVRLMTLASIAFLTLHDIINIPAVTIFGVEHRFDDGFTYGQSFWMTVCSTLVSTATNITLIIDYNRTRDFKHAGDGLTPKQRSLVIIIIILLSYVSFGSLIQSLILKMSFIDALYFSVVSIESIGFGDIPPNSTGARIFTCFYIAGGILNLALAVALAREALLEAAALSFRDRLKAVRVRHRQKRIRKRWRAGIRWRLRAKGLPVWIDHNNRPQRHSGHRHRWYNWGLRIWDRATEAVGGRREDPSVRYLHGNRYRRLNLEALPTGQLEAAAWEAGAPLSKLVPDGLLPLPHTNDDGRIGVPLSRRPTEDHHNPSLTQVHMGGMVAIISKFAMAVSRPNVEHPKPPSTLDEDDEDDEDSSDFRPSGSGVPLSRSTTMQESDDHDSFVQNLQEEERNAFYARLSVALIMFVVFWMAGSAIFMQTEGWSYGIAVYFCFISFTTVGYGDYSPKTPAGRSIFVVWALLGVGTMTILISILAEAYSTRYKSLIKSEVYNGIGTSFDDDGKSTRQPFSDSRTILNTVTDQEFPSQPNSASQPNSNFAQSSATAAPRPSRSRRPSMAPIPELRLTIPGTQKAAINSSNSGNSSLEALPSHVLRHVEGIKALMLTLDPSTESFGEEREIVTVLIDDSRNLRNFLAQLDRSLRDLSRAAKEALDGPNHSTSTL